jgi:hypothetical protein
MPIQWRDAETDFLVNERRYHNDEFHSMPGRS